jgi:hypothetical protein
MSIFGCARLAIGLALSLSLSLLGCNTPSANNADNPDAGNDSEVSTSNDRLSGQWRITDGIGETATFIFTPEGKLYIISDATSEAIELEYQKISDDPTLPENVSLTSPKNQVANARVSEAKTIVGALNRAQQAFYLETATFTDDLQQLGLGIAVETDNYTYEIVLADDGIAQNMAIAKDPALNSYLGVVYLVNEGEGVTTYAAICQSNAPTTEAPQSPTFNSDAELSCPAGYSRLD